MQIDGQKDAANRNAAAETTAEVRRIEQKFSRYVDGSIVSRINRSAGQRAVAVFAETGSLLDFVHALWQLSGGLFDITSGVLRRAWDFKAGQLQKPQVLQTVLDQVRWQHVKRHDGQVRLAGENPASTLRS